MASPASMSLCMVIAIKLKSKVNSPLMSFLGNQSISMPFIAIGLAVKIESVTLEFIILSMDSIAIQYSRCFSVVQ